MDRTWELTSILHNLKAYHADQAELYIRNKVTKTKNIMGHDVSRDVRDMQVKHPLTGKRDSLNNVIITLNDDAKWSRERIADWLDTLDEQPVFYPTIEKSSITDTERSYFLRDMEYGPPTMTIRYACNCFMTQQNRKITCGLCWENRYAEAFGHFGDGFVHDCRRHDAQD